MLRRQLWQVAEHRSVMQYIDTSFELEWMVQSLISLVPILQDFGPASRFP